MTIDDLPIRRANLREQGVTDAQIDYALKAGRYVASPRGVLIPSHLADDFTARAQAAVDTQRDDVVLFGRSAAVALDLPFTPLSWSRPSEPIHVAAARDDTTRVQRRGVFRHIRAVPDDATILLNGMRVSNPARTLCDLAYSEPRLLVVQLLDAALRRKRCDQSELAQTLTQFRRLRNVRRQRDLVGLARLGVDSPPETEIRLIVRDAGLPEPQPRIEIWNDAEDLLLACGDLGYWLWLIWIEYDGFDEHNRELAFGTDRFRDRWVDGRGWKPFRVTNADRRSPRAFLEQLHTAIDEAPARIAALPPSKSPEVAQARRLLGIDPPDGIAA